VKLVLVDDNADFALSMRMLLEIRGYEVRAYITAQEFLQDLGNLAEDDILITDYYLPDLNGIEVVKRARAKRPGLRAILLTGSREDSVARAARAIRNCRIEYKPLHYEALERGIKEVLARKRGKPGQPSL
jgi:DNA-binding NtrC family response regulator